MSPFFIVCNNAKDGVLARHPQAAYLASDEFRQRIAFEGEQGLADRVGISLFVLNAVSLDPRFSDDSYNRLKTGYVHLALFGVADVVDGYYVPADSEYAITLQKAVRANMVSPMFGAAQRVRKWRDRSSARYLHETAVRDKLRDQQDWPTPEDFKRDSVIARERQRVLSDELDVKINAVRALRNSRLAKLSQAASPGVKSWTDFLVDISLNVLSPLWKVTLKIEDGQEFKWTGSADDQDHAEGQAITDATAETGQQVFEVLSVIAP